MYRCRFDIYRRAILLVGLVQAIAASALIFVNVHEDRRDSEQALRSRLIEMSDWLAGSVSNSLWELNRDTVEVIVAGISQDHDFVAATVKDEQGRVFVEIGTGDVDDGAVVSRTTDIVFDVDGTTRTIGSLDLSLSREHYDLEQKEAFIAQLVLGFGQLAAVLVAVALGLRTLVRPLELITRRMVEVASGEMQAPIPYGDRHGPIGNVARAVKLFRDAMRERARIEDELRGTQRELEHRVAERTAKVEKQASELADALQSQIEYNNLQQEFVSLASHEFRTPLAIIDGAAQRMIRRADQLSGEAIRERSQHIRGAVTRMTGLIDSTLSAQQIEAGKVKMEPQSLDLRALLQSVQDRQAEIAPSHRIALDLQDAPDEIQGDPRLLEHVFTNLLSNAVKYSPDNSKVDVRCYTEGDQVLVTVRDYGIGVPADELPRLFQRYFRARTSVGIAGTGIGLHVVQSFVEMHGGHVEVESVEGRGSTFTVRLPLPPGARQVGDGRERGDPIMHPGVTAAALP